MKKLIEFQIWNLVIGMRHLHDGIKRAYLTQLTLIVIEKVLKEVKIDYSDWWEDMCFRGGPLISPKLFEKLMVPRYKRITDLLAKYPKDITVWDCCSSKGRSILIN